MAYVKLTELMEQYKTNEQLVSKLIEENPKVIDCEGVQKNSLKVIDALASFIVEANKPVKLPNLDEETYAKVLTKIDNIRKIRSSATFLSSLKEGDIVRVFTDGDYFFGEYKKSYKNFILFEKILTGDLNCNLRYNVTVNRHDLKIGQASLEPISQEDKEFLKKKGILN